MPLAWLVRIPAWVWLCAGLAGWGAWARMGELRAQEKVRVQAEQLAASTAREQASEQARKIDKEHHARKTAVAAAARDTAGRLRELPAAASNPEAAAQCRDHERPGAVVSDDARSDLVALAKRADEVAEQLRACQAYVRGD